MSEQGPKIITSFQDRLELDADLRALGETTSDTQLRALALQIAEKYGDRALPAVISLLDTDSAQLRGGLGYLAVLLDQERTIGALQAAARNRSLSDRARLAAITILERYLGVATDDSMYAGMAAPEQLALSSLQEALAEAKSDPLILVEYFAQLSLEPHDVLLSMVQGTRQLDAGESVLLLRMFAQDPFLPAAQEAIRILGSLTLPEAAEALRSLLPTLPPDLSPPAERLLQKQRLRGIPVAAAEPPPAGSRCLASPVDYQDNQALWFFIPTQEPKQADVLQVVLSGDEGLGDAAGRFDVLWETFPAAIPIGTLHRVDPTGPMPGLLEVPFDYGRRRVQAALAVTWQGNRYTPIPYRLFSAGLWRWTQPEPGALIPEPADISRQESRALLDHPAFQTWYLRSRQIYATARDLLTAPNAPGEEAFQQAVQRLLADALATSTLQLDVLRQSLVSMAEWLSLSGDDETAGRVLAVQPTLHQAPEDHPLLLGMTERGLRIALVNLTRGLHLAVQAGRDAPKPTAGQ